MGKTLYLTEKPSVAQEFAKALKQNFTRKNGYLESDQSVITWCVGHLVTMSYPQKYDEKYKKWNLADLPFLPEKYLYEIIPNVKDQYKVVKEMMHRKDIDTMLYCGDAGREGEYIGRLVRMVGGINPNIIEKRVWIDSQTEDEILRGIREAKPLSEYDGLADAGALRAIEDYAFGINFSRALSCLHGKAFNQMIGASKWTPISVGRVMTCVLGMIVDRENQITNFKETIFYKIAGMFDGVSAEWKCEETSVYRNAPNMYKDIGFLNEKDADAFCNRFNGKPATIDKLEVKETKKAAPLLFNLAELQNECSKRFKISPDETLAIVQALYEAKLTTYPRTDARVLSSAVAKEIKKNLNGLKGLAFCMANVNQIFTFGDPARIEKTHYTDDKKITDHYAIIPTGDISKYNSLNDLQRSVYELIVKRFLAIFYPSAVYTNAKVIFQIETERFHASGKQLKSPGYLEVYGKDTEEEEEETQSSLLTFIASHKTGDKVISYNLESAEGKTTPPKRYNSGSIILAMENAGQLIEDEDLRAQIKGSGIGTSATRAEILNKLAKLGYIYLNKKTQIITPAAPGYAVYDIVKQTVPDFLSPEMTAEWETKLTNVANGAMQRSVCETNINDYIRKKMSEIKSSSASFNALPEGVKTGAGKTAGKTTGKGTAEATCPLCGGKVFANTKAYSCSNWNKDPKCGFVIWKNTLDSMKAKLTDGDVAKLCAGKNIKKKLTSKAGKTWEQELCYNKATGKIEFVK